MLVLLPFFIIGVGISAGVCSAAGYTGAVLAGMFAVYFVAAFVGSILLYVLCLALISVFVDKTKPQQNPDTFFCAMTNHVMGLLTVLSRIRLHVSGMELLPQGRWLFVCNHKSNYDPIVTGWALRRYGVAFISKPENFRLPLVSAFIHKSGSLPIDRENDRAALRTILAAAARMKQNLVSYIIYPEGSRNLGEGMLPFRNGAFKIAQKAGTPIVIASIRGTELIKKRFPWRSTDVYLNICKVLDAESVAERKTAEIGEEVRECIISANT